MSNAGLIKSTQNHIMHCYYGFSCPHNEIQGLGQYFIEGVLLIRVDIPKVIAVSILLQLLIGRSNETDYSTGIVLLPCATRTMAKPPSHNFLFSSHDPYFYFIQEETKNY